MKRNTDCRQKGLGFFLVLFMIALPMIVPVASHSQTTDLTIGNYAKISERRITRTVYEYTYRADVTNSGPAVLNVAATATSTSPYTTIIDNTLSFGDVPAGATVTSSDTFTFRHDRSYAFSWSNLSWNISFELAGNQPPVANAGQDQDVTVGSLVTLDGRNSSDPDGDIISYRWVMTPPSGSGASLINPTSVMPTFTPDVSGEYRISLTVNDGQADSAPDEVIIIATMPNVAPTAIAGPDQSVVTGNTVFLDGRGSFDPDGDPLTYQWQILSSPAGSTAFLNDPSSATPTFLADVAGQYIILLTVNDGEIDSLPDDVIIISAIPNAPPVSDAGDDQIVSKNTTIQLDGQGSSDPNNDTLTYNWSIVSKPA